MLQGDCIQTFGGRRIEYWLISRMLREGLDVYIPLVDDFGIDQR